MATKRRTFWVALLGFPSIVLILFVYLKPEPPMETKVVPYTAILTVNNRTLYHVTKIALYEVASKQEKLLLVQKLFVPSHSMLPVFTTLDCKRYDVLVSFEGGGHQFFEKVDICQQEIELTRKGFKEKNVSFK